MMFRAVSLFFLVITLSACSLSPVKAPDVQRYRISRASLKSYRKQALDASILVSKPIANPGYQTDAMIYTKQPYHLQRFVKHKWVKPPSSMIQSMLVQSLRHSRIFRAVMTTPFVGITRYRLDTNLIELQQEFIRRPSKVRLVLQASVIDKKSRKIIASHRFGTVMTAPSEDPYGGVEATNRATAELMHQIISWLSKIIR